MTAFFIAATSIKDMEKFQKYAAEAGKTLAPYGGELVLRGKAEKTLVGHAEHQAVGVVRFADMDALNNWYQSAAYQALIPLRESAADMTLTAYNEPA